MQQAQPDVDDALRQVACIDTMPALLQMLNEVTGLGFIGVSRVTESSWTACAVYDAIHFGMQVGTQLDISLTFCAEVRRSRTPIVIDHASVDPKYRDHLVPKICCFESLVTVPIVTADGEYFGALFGVDRAPRSVSAPWVLKLFNSVAQMVASHLDGAQHEREAITPRFRERTASLDEHLLGALDDDLRKPADAIYEAADLLEKECMDVSVRELASGVKRRARRLAFVAAHMRDFIRGGLGDGIELRVEQSVWLESNLNRILSDLRLSHPRRRIIANIAVGRPVHCDPHRIAQLVWNLVEAALTQAGPEGPVSIAAAFEDSGLSIDVWNAGEPIPADRIDHFFAASWQPTATGSPIDSLSLHVCRLIVEAHHGFISVISNKAHGTQFSVWIPVPTAGITSLVAFRRRMAETGVSRLSP